MKPDAPDWDDALAAALLAPPLPRNAAELLARLPARWRADPAVRRAAADALWLHRHAAAAFGTRPPAEFAARLERAVRNPRPQPRWPWLAAGACAAALLAGFLLRPPVAAGPGLARNDAAPPPAELRLDFGQSLFALAAAPRPEPAWLKVALPAGDPAAPLRATQAELGARVQPVAASVGKAFAFLGEFPALPGRTM